MKNLLAGIGIFCLTSTVQAATVPGFSDVTDNGDGSFTFVFDTSVTDIVGSGLAFSNGAGLGFEVSASIGALPASVVQSSPVSGGLGVRGTVVGNTFDPGEELHFAFNQAVNIRSFTLNDPFTDAATSGFNLSDGVNTIFAPAANFDGVGVEAIQQGSLCPSFGFLCNITGFDVGTDGFRGFVESITIEAAPAPVPLPASIVFLLAGLGGFSVIGRKRASVDR